jgi:vanillate O-demethylase monooxygenase subunit
MMTPSLRNYWHPVGRIEDIGTGPVGTTLLDQKLVVYHDGDRYVALRDLCSHRGTRLSLGTVTAGGEIRCPYHGWTYESGGRCVYIPAQPKDHQRIPSAAVVPSYRVEERYGLVWVALDDPIAPIPAYPEFDAAEMRTILAGHWTWAASAGRFLENNIDTAHLPIVHPGLLGDLDHTEVEAPQLRATEHELYYAASRRETEQAHYDEPGALITRETWVVLPFSWRMRISTSRGTMALFTVAQPISDRSCSHWLYCSRDYRLAPPDDLAYDAEIREVNAVILEQDRVMVESQEPEALPLDLTEEVHLRVADAACLEYRRRLKRLAGTAYA